MEDAVARRRVIRLPDPVQPRELTPDPGLLVVVGPAGEDEVIVGDRRLAGIDEAAAGDLIEGVNGEGRGAVRRRQQVGVDAERRAGLDLGVRVDPMRPHDLLGRGHPARALRIGPLDPRRGGRRRGEFPPADRDDPAAAPDLVFLRRQRHRIVGLALRLVRQPARIGVEAEFVAVGRIGHRLGTLDDFQAEVERVAAKDVAHVPAADDHHLQSDFFGDAFESRRAHLPRRTDGESIAGHQERLAAMHPRAEIRHQVAERPRLPTLVERGQALGDAIGGRRNLIGVDGVELLFLPEDLAGPRKSAPGLLRSPSTAERRLRPARPARSGKRRARVGRTGSVASRKRRKALRVYTSEAPPQTAENSRWGVTSPRQWPRCLPRRRRGETLVS